MLNSDRKIILTLSFFLITSLLYSGNIKKGFEALAAYDYFKAKNLFEKSLKKKIVPASYGLSIIYFRTDNPFHHLDSASKYIRLTKKEYEAIETKDRTKLTELNIDSLKIESQKDRIDSALYLNADQLASFDVYEAYIASYPTSKLIPVAIESRNKVKFEAVEKKNTALAYKEFIESYPNAKQINRAKTKYEELLYVEQTRLGDVESYMRFVKQYPKSPYNKEAQDSVYKLQTRAKTISSYDRFVRSNPQNVNVNRAWRNLYKLYTANYSSERIVEFRIDYPDYPFKNEVEIDMKLAKKEFLPFKNKGKWGFMDTDGMVMIASKYDFVEPFQEGLALVMLNDLLGFIDKSGKTIIPLEYEDGESFVNGLAIVAKNDNYGMINRANKLVVPLRYEILTSFTNGLALVADKNGYGFVNEKGAEIIPVNLSYATEFKDGYAVVEVDDKKGVVNAQGQFVVDAKYPWLENFNEKGIARAKNDTAYGLLNIRGEEVTPFIYDQIGVFNSGLAIAKKGEKYGYLDAKGEIKIPIKYDFSEGTLLWGQFENGYTKYSRKGKFGIIDTTGKERVPSIFENILNYTTNNLIQVKKRGKWGYMNTELQLKISYEYLETLPYYRDKAAVKKDTAWGIINQKGKWLVEPVYSKIEGIQDSLFIIKSEESFGLMSNSLAEIIPTKYNRIVLDSANRRAQLFEDRKMYYFDLEKKEYIKPINDD